MAEAGCDAIKLEGGAAMADRIRGIVDAGIPAIGHLGLTPQSVNAIGRARVQGRTREQARALLADAHAVQEAGAFAIVLELMPEQLAAAVTERVRIPTIGIGAGAGCSGQVQVLPDLLGLDAWRPRHARAYADLRGTILAAAAASREDDEAGRFPGPAESSRMDDAVLDEVLGRSPLDRETADGGTARGDDKRQSQDSPPS